MLPISIHKTVIFQSLQKSQVRFGNEGDSSSPLEDRYTPSVGEGKNKREHRSKAYERLIGTLPSSSKISETGFELFQRIKLLKQAENERLIAAGQREW